MFCPSYSLLIIITVQSPLARLEYNDVRDLSHLSSARGPRRGGESGGRHIKDELAIARQLPLLTHILVFHR